MNQQNKSSTVEDISIVMCVYNHEDTVSEALESVLNQETNYRYVIYCLNDASTDNSCAVIQAYADKYPEKVKLFTTADNQGTGKKSILFHNPPVNGKYWALLAGDDYWTDNNKLNEQISFLEAEDDFVGCSSYTIMKNEINGEESFFKPRVDSFNLLDLHLNEGSPSHYVHPSSIVWKNIYRDKKSFLPHRFRLDIATGDVMLKNAMLVCGKKMKIIPKVMSCYRYTGKGVWSSLTKEEQSHFNASLLSNIVKILPFKWKLILLLQKSRLNVKGLKAIIPGPINE